MRLKKWIYILLSFIGVILTTGVFDAGLTVGVYAGTVAKNAAGNQDSFEGTWIANTLK